MRVAELNALWINTMTSTQQLTVDQYSVTHSILFVGEASFAFSSMLASAFGSARNIVATTKDSHGTFQDKYGADGEAAVNNLKRRGASVKFEVDVTMAAIENSSSLFGLQFDRIVFNYPHAGYHLKRYHFDILHHQELIRDFFSNVSPLLKHNGELHVTHKKTVCKRWRFNKYAASCGLQLKQSLLFIPTSFPGYTPCRGAGKTWYSTFPLHESRTYVYVI